jgi:hypothetical protein
VSIQTHNVVADGATGDQVAVLDAYPGGQSVGITASSSGVNTGQITTLIERAAGRLNAILASKGMDPDDLGADETATVQAGIVAYAVSRTLYRVMRIEEARPWDEEWQETLRTLRERPGDMGDAQDEAPGPVSNVSSSVTRKWGTDFKGW